jgi:hypothetical protein
LRINFSHFSKRYLEINGNLEIPTGDSGKKYMSDVHNRGGIIVIGAGFTGLTASYEIARQGIPVTVLEKDNQVGGLAGNFQLGSQHLEKFYHHLFNHDWSAPVFGPCYESISHVLHLS